MTPRKATPLVKLLIDAGPLAAFFAVFKFGDKLMLGGGLMPATGVLIVATLIATVVAYIIERRIALMPLITAGLVVVFGGLTLWLADETFIKMKPTIVYLLFAAALLGGLALGRPFLKSLFQMAFHLTDEGWRILTLRWGLFFIAMAVLNEIVWRNFSTDLWVDLKVFGFLPLTMLFALAQIPLVRARSLPEEPKSS
ncbi:MAG: septation protein A [Alphaproteobacteria bacterium]